MYHRQQRGMSFWGLLFVLGVIAFCAYLGIKLFTPYMEDFKVKAALDSLVRQPDIASMSRADIATALVKRFDIDNISSVKLDKDLTIEQRGKMKVIRISYEYVTPVAGNISLLIEFNHSKEVRSSGE